MGFTTSGCFGIMCGAAKPMITIMIVIFRKAARTDKQITQLAGLEMAISNNNVKQETLK